MENITLLHKYEIKKYHFPVSGYNYYVMIWASADGGRTFWNCGHGKAFVTLEEAENYVNEREMEG